MLRGGGSGGCDLHGPLCCTSLGAFFFFFPPGPFWPFTSTLAGCGGV